MRNCSSSAITVATIIFCTLLLASCGENHNSHLLEETNALVGGSCPMDITWQLHKLEGNDLRFLNYAVTRLGQRIGRGECWDLADQALESLPSVMYHRGLGPGGDYKWGLLSATITRANPVANLRPGMILQFRDAVFHWRRNRKVYLRKAEHHTAIVSAVSDDKNDLCILHQNESGVRQVTFGYYRISSIKGGTVWAYAPHWLSSNEQPQQD